MTRQLLVHDTPQTLAAAAAARLVTEVVDAIAARGRAHVVLTGGSNGNALMAALAASPARTAVDWHRVDFYWGDERFVPADDDDRNEKQARAALLDALDLDPRTVHAMPPSDGPDGDDVDAAANRYAADLVAAGGGAVPEFDVVLLGVGPDGHVASLFPGHPGLAVGDHSVIAVRESPKPPPTRITLTMPVLCSSRQVWLLASGAGKAEAVAKALTPVPGEPTLPARRVHGEQRTLWFLDRESAPAP
ncbi:6-phosphogluconolactonase [Spongisporangium articulatum]|uniref:6-phosphogluconolactonase n=1 Tax=Spongisporangium articulatum TaxID=3362603 RepID=A0ABW8ARI3_9ACTN